MIHTTSVAKAFSKWIYYQIQNLADNTQKPTATCFSVRWPLALA
jgi:hypothetical protein